MKRLFLLLLAVTVVTLYSGCKTHSGSRDYIPGKGWVPND